MEPYELSRGNNSWLLFGMVAHNTTHMAQKLHTAAMPQYTPLGHLTGQFK